MYYKPSGKISMPSATVAILAIILAAPVLAFVYTYAVWYIPFIYINFLVTFFTGFAMFFVITLITKACKSRNKTFNVLLGLLGGLLLSYVNWSVWIDLVINSSESYNLGNRLGVTVSSSSFGNLFLLLQNPSIMIEYASQINEVGTWGIRSATVSGWFLGIIWIIEAGMLIGVPLVLTYWSDIEPFCELSNTWAEKKESTFQYELIEDPLKLKADLEAKQYGGLLEMKIKEHSAIDFAKVVVYYLREGAVFYLTITNEIGKYDKGGKLEYTSIDVVKFIEAPKDVCLELLTKTPLENSVANVDEGGAGEEV
jgi:hypothetical protein